MLRLRGISFAEKFAGRTAGSGLVSLAVSDRFGAAIKIACETDFAARNDLVRTLARHLPSMLSPMVRDIQHCRFKEQIHPQIRSLLVSDAFMELSSLIGEKVELQSIDLIDADFVGSYVHETTDSVVGTKGALVGFNGRIPPGFESFGKSVARHVLAFPPKYISLSSVDHELLESESNTLKGSCADDESFDKRWKRFVGEIVLEEATLLSDSDADVSVKAAIDDFVVKCGGASGSVALSSFIAIGV